MRIDRLELPGGEAIGLTHMPGRGGDLARDLSAIRAWGAGLLISFTMAAELPPGFDLAVAAAGLAWHHLPIRDFGVPDAAQVAALDAVVRDRTVLHCAHGLGRTGTMAAALLVARGVPAAFAIEDVRRVRPGAIETRAQETFLRGYAPAASSTCSE